MPDLDDAHRVYSVLDSLLPNHAYMLIAAPLEDGKLSEQNLYANVSDAETLAEILEGMAATVRAEGTESLGPVRRIHDA